MAGCRITPKNSQCGVTPTEEKKAVTCKPFDVCLSFGRRLVSDGSCITVVGSSTITDGWYGEVSIINGCIVDARPAQVPVYTPAPCSPAALPCEDTGGGGGNAAITLSPDACNLLEFVNGNLDATLFFGDHTGVTVTGCGTMNSPLTFSVASQTSTVSISAGTPAAISVSGSGASVDPFTISHIESPIQAGQLGAFEVDRFGHIIGYDETRNSALTGVADGAGITMTNTSGIISADLKATGVAAGQYTLGGYTVAINSYGQATDVRRDINLTPNTFALGAYDVTVNSAGSITAITPIQEDTTAIPDTFVGSYRGDAASVENERTLTFTTSFGGPLHVEYRGLLGATSLDPGQSMTFPAGFSIAVDDVMLTDPLVEVAGVFNVQPGVGQNAIVAIRATSMNSIGPGQHTVTITTPSNIITQRDGFMRVQVVGRGA